MKHVSELGLLNLHMLWVWTVGILHRVSGIHGLKRARYSGTIPFRPYSAQPWMHL